MTQLPGFVPVPDGLRREEFDRGDDCWRAGRVEDARAAYEAVLASDIGHFGWSLAFKRIASLLINTQGLDAAFRHYGLERADDNDVSIEPDDILCCTTVRDEADRLVWFLEYYERLGVDRFLFVDNQSSDETQAVLAGRPNVNIWRSDMDYKLANYGIAWVELLLRAYGSGHWCLVVDADEMLCYPSIETRKLRDICTEFDRQDKAAMSAVLLDMYSKGPIGQATCHSGQNPLDVCRFFDREFCHDHITDATVWHNIDGFSGGVRRRVGGEKTNVFLSKVPLVRYAEDRVLMIGTHGTNLPRENIAVERAALLHCKFTSRFVQRINKEVELRSTYREQGESYATYADMLREDPLLTFYHPLHSVRLADSRQLLDLGIMVDPSAGQPAGA